MKFPIEIKTKTGKLVTIRLPAMSDDQILLDFINTLSKEHTYITYQGEQLTLQEERDFIEKRLKKIKNHEAVHLIALIDGGIVIANTSIELGLRVNNHIGIFGIAIADGYRDEGLGTTLIKLLIENAKESLPNIKIIELKVFANNPKAFHVYEKHGFKEFGRLPKAVLFCGEYIDEIYMYKAL